jgi:hypoxanthine phosphoribosyltransferase
MTSRVFVSYRRQDAAAEASLLAVLLRQRFGRRTVFLDTSTIAAGDRWPGRLLDALADSDVVLAVIGQSYLTTGKAGYGLPRIFGPDDWVRLELAEAIRLRKRIIPVLVNRATMPFREQLPDELHPLLEFQAFEFRTGNAEADAETLGDFFAPTIKLTWEKFDHAIAHLGRQMSAYADLLVGVGVGGTIVASTLAGNLNRNFLCFDREVVYDAENHRISKLLDDSVTEGRRELVAGRRVVVVSAEIVSGATTDLATKLMQRLGAASVAICCVYAYEGRTIDVDYFFRERRRDGIAQMPWRILDSYVNPDDLARPAATESDDEP